MKKMLTTIFILLSISGLSAGTKYGADFLNGPSDIRYLGGGESFIALPKGPGCINYNPAGLGVLEEDGAEVNYIESLLSSRIFYANYAQELSEGEIGGSFNYRSSGKFQAIDGVGIAYDDLSATDLSFSVGYAIPFIVGDILASGGASLKGMMESMRTYRNLGFCADLGFMVQMPLLKIATAFDEEEADNFSLALTVKNLGLPLKNATEMASLPLTVNAGLGYRFFELNRSFVDLAVSGGMDLSSAVSSLGTGIEACWEDAIFLRLGYKFASEIPFSAGVGLKNMSDNFTYQIDFSYSVHEIDNIIGIGFAVNI